MHVCMQGFKAASFYLIFILILFCSKRLCWCTNVIMVWLRLTCRLTACQPHHTTVSVI